PRGARKRPPSGEGGSVSRRSGGLDVLGAVALGVRLDLEGDPLAAGEPVEVERRGEAAAVEEVLLAVLGRDEAEAAVGDDLLDGAVGHVDPPTWSRTSNCRRAVGSSAGPHDARPKAGRGFTVARPRRGQRQRGGPPSLRR